MCRSLQPPAMQLWICFRICRTELARVCADSKSHICLVCRLTEAGATWRQLGVCSPNWVPTLICEAMATGMHVRPCMSCFVTAKARVWYCDVLRGICFSQFLFPTISFTVRLLQVRTYGKLGENPCNISSLWFCDLDGRAMLGHAVWAFILFDVCFRRKILVFRSFCFQFGQLRRVYNSLSTNRVEHTRTQNITCKWPQYFGQ